MRAPARPAGADPTGANPAGAGPAGGRSRRDTAGAALGLLRERAWLGALLGVVVLSLVFVLLGRWQYHRHEARSARNALIQANYEAAPTPLGQVLPAATADPGRPLPANLEWRPVSLRGRYLEAGGVLLRNRPHDEQNGYDVVVPFRAVDGVVLFVNRGWIPAGTRSAAGPDAVPAPPVGEVDVVVRLRPAEPAATRRAPAGQANRLDVEALAAGLDPADAGRVVGAYGQLISESRTTPTGGRQPLAPGRPDPGLGINLAYAVQWVAFAVTAYVLLGVSMVREVRRRRGDEPAPWRLPWSRRERDEFDEE